MKLLAAFIIAASFNVKAQTIDEGAFVCTTPELWEEGIRAYNRKDTNALTYVFANGCGIINASYPVTILDKTFTGLTKVRVYVGNDTVEVWVAREALSEALLTGY